MAGRPTLDNAINTGASSHPHPRLFQVASPLMPHTQSAAELLELGKAYYSERKYERAVKAFMDVSGALNPPSTALIKRARLSARPLPRT